MHVCTCTHAYDYLFCIIKIGVLGVVIFLALQGICTHMYNTHLCNSIRYIHVHALHVTNVLELVSELFMFPYYCQNTCI